MSVTHARIDVRPFDAADLDAASELLAARHRRHRVAEPALDPAYEDPTATRAQVEALLANPTASGWVAALDGRVDGFLIGAAKDEAVWGPNVWIEAPGHAASEPAVIRRLYAVAAAHWVDDGRTNHHALVPASDAALVDAWFTLDFGQQHLHAAREVPATSFGVVPRNELVIRRADQRDVEALVELEQVLPAHLTGSPVFSRLPPTPSDEVRREVEADIVDPSFHFLVAEYEGAVIGTAVACSLEVSTGATGLNRPANAGYLAYAAVLPAGRGLGAGRALGEAVLAWCRDAGYEWVATDWRSTNLEADRAWRALGFRPTFRRLHRTIL